ncbi:uncharacterized protein NPIL_650891, partial [Nephila pilipes]
YPVSVKITTKNTALSANSSVEIICESVGSRPSAKITWWLNGTLLSDHTETVHDNITSSTLRLRPKPQYHGTSLECRADNPKLFNSHKQDSRLLNITCGQTSSDSSYDQGGGQYPTKGGRFRPTSLRRRLQPDCPEGGLAFQRLTPFPQRVSHGHRKWQHARLQAANATQQRSVHVLRHQRRRQRPQRGARPQH